MSEEAMRPTGLAVPATEGQGPTEPTAEPVEANGDSMRSRSGFDGTATKFHPAPASTGRRRSTDAPARFSVSAAPLAALFGLVTALTMAAVSPLASQAGSLTLTEARALAEATDPTSAKPELIERAASLRLSAITRSRLPQFTIAGQATVQNEVPTIGIDLPNFDLPTIPREQYQLSLNGDWAIYDGGLSSRRRRAERAGLAADLAEAAVTTDALRNAASQAFFGSLLYAARSQTLADHVADLEARLDLVRARAANGAALVSDAGVVEAELIRVRHQAAEAAAESQASLTILSDLIGERVESADALVIPDLGDLTDQALELASELGNPIGAGPIVADSVSIRPELIQLRRSADRLRAQARIREAGVRPKLSLFGRAGVARPSPFNFLSDEIAEFGIVGVQLSWPIFDGGQASREAEALRVQAQALEADEAAFGLRILREIEEDRSAIEWLEQALPEDERAVELRADAARVAGRQMEEGVLLPDAYVDRLTDLADARLMLELHRIQLAQARTSLLTTLGLFPDSPSASRSPVPNRP